jgi:hypothetical protein
LSWVEASPESSAVLDKIIALPSIEPLDPFQALKYKTAAVGDIWASAKPNFNVDGTSLLGRVMAAMFFSVLEVCT